MTRWHMKEHTSAEKLALLWRIKNAGCPAEIDPELQSGREGLIIRQVGDVTLSRVFDIPHYGTGYMVNVSITCDMTEFRIDDYDLLLPWEDPQFRWLEAGERAVQDLYSFPCEDPLEFHREDVINHAKRLLRRGHQIEGLLLGIGPAPIPDRYQRGGIEAKLSVLDHLGNSFRSTLQLCVDRSARQLSKFSCKPSRSRLFEEVEGIRAKADA